MTETTSSTTEAPQKTWRDTDTYVWLMLHTGGNEKRVEAMRNILNSDDIVAINSPEFVAHIATHMPHGHGVVAAFEPDDFPYGQPTVRLGHPSVEPSHGQATRELTKRFVTRKADFNWRVVFVFDHPTRRDLEDLRTATRLHGRPVSIICATPRDPSIRLSASRTLTELAPVLNTTRQPEDADTNTESFFFQPNRPVRS